MNSLTVDEFSYEAVRAVASESSRTSVITSLQTHSYSEVQTFALYAHDIEDEEFDLRENVKLEDNDRDELRLR